MRANFAKQLRNISLNVRSEATDDMEEMIAFQEAETRKRIGNNLIQEKLRKLRSETNGRVIFIYFVCVVTVSFVAALFIKLRKNLFAKPDAKGIRRKATAQ